MNLIKNRMMRLFLKILVNKNKIKRKKLNKIKMSNHLNISLYKSNNILSRLKSLQKTLS